MENIPLDMFFAAMATRLDGPRADGKELTFNFVFSDVGKTEVVHVENGVLHHREAPADPGADATVTLTRAFWLKLVTSQASIKDMIVSDQFKVAGSRVKLVSFFRLLDAPDGNFPIVTP
jgi:alkyl sulfatase BDS1-like metallo-beta-lactamase superfamily hydrolase